MSTMNCWRFWNNRLRRVLAAVVLSACCLQDSRGETNRVQPASDPGTVLPPSAPVQAVSPIQYFRRLLEMSPEERDRALSDKAPDQRKYIEAKLGEYERLSPAQREMRLRVTELRYYLVPLMKAAPEERGTLLSAVPEQERPLIEERLRQWDQLPAETRRKVLESERAVQAFLRLEQTAVPLSEEARRSLEAKLAEWRALPMHERQRLYEHFRQFFALPPEQREKTLSTLPPNERAGIEKVLVSFERMPPEARITYLENFRKLANLEPEDREQFWRNAELWQAMTPRERRAWRHLLTLPPPPPPGTTLPLLPPGAVQTSPPVGIQLTNRPPPGASSIAAPPPPGAAW